MKKRIALQGGFWSILEMLIVAVIIMVVATWYLRLNVTKPSVKPNEAAAFKEMGVDTASYQSTVESTKARVNEVNNLLKEREAAAERAGE